MRAVEPSGPLVGIRRLTIENFRGFANLDLSFVGPSGAVNSIVVLGGPNGCGKTTVLEACLIAAGRKDLAGGKTDSSAARSPLDRYMITAEIEGEGGRRTVRIENGIRLGTDGADVGEAIALDLPCAYFSSWRAPDRVGAVDITLGRRGRRPDDTDANRLRNVKQFLVNSKARAAMGGPLLPNIVSAYEEAIGRLNAVWRTFRPASGQEFSVEPAGDDEADGFDVFLADSDGRRIELDALSAGELEVLAFFGWMLSERFRSGLIVIDEPELHLDPQWHVLMLRAMQAFQPRSQFIVATHSPRVFESVMSFERILLVPDTDPRAAPWKPVEAAP